MIKGEASTSWTENESSTSNTDEQENTTNNTVNYTGHEEYFNINYYLLGGTHSKSLIFLK